MTARTILAKLHGRTAVGVPRWAVWTAYATTLTTLPSCVWRIVAINLHGPLLERSATVVHGHGLVLFTGLWYVVALSIVSEGLAYLTVGLVSEWGEVVPRWIPGLGGRRVPILAAVVPAGLGAAVLSVLFPYTLLMLSLGRMVNGTRGTGVVVHGWQAVVFAVSYAPLAAWGPLLGTVTVHYYRRRRRAAGHPVTARQAGAALPG
ncbi:hypothetical protein P3T36_006837 [Kitasatospora sp. MAP12-15]|uniref:hypothetical protein n=1 Tax=unclassified Kitasatospora TaxID=2633591 RepID=UPI002476FDD6|nr:hypothetical protein [Kitasatospora sp. MAP12-44]MDH6112136.1 hypothetical protein [Kitasatospora sp. MAP12-44]